MGFRSVLVLVLIAVGCGSGANRGAASERPPLTGTTVQVPQQDPEPNEVASDDPPSERARSAEADSLTGCAVSLRDARQLPSPSAEREPYDRARGAEARRDFATARRSYYDLIQKFPTSKLIPYAYLAFGELFAGEAVSDPAKWDLARAAYQEVAKYPPPDNGVYPYALLRLGDTFRPSDGQQALLQYSKALEAARQYQSLPCADAIRAEARTKVAEVFAEIGAPDKAYVFFKAKEETNPALEMMESLVEQYRKAGKAGDACAALRGIPQQDGDAASRLRARAAELCAKK